MKQHNTRGSLLIEALISIFVLAIGILGIARLQSDLISRGNDAQFRFHASLYANELLSMASIDRNNANCYSLPVPNTCVDTFATKFMNNWSNMVAAALPAAATNPPTVVIDANNRMTITIQWRKQANEALHRHILIGQL